MRKELDDKLCAAHPGIFRDRHGDPKHTLMCYGFPGDGWYDLIDVLCTAIEQRVGMGTLPVAVQVKEKFGLMRFYVDGHDEIIAAMIGLAEDMSGRICEDCGAPGTTGGRSWIKTRCEACRVKRP